MMTLSIICANANAISAVANSVMAVMAIAAGVVSWREHKRHKTQKNDKLLSQLNRRYIGNNDIQTVVKYLRKIDASDEVPNAYQTELFLRFFEELGVYLRNDSLPVEDVKNFFNFYLKQMYATERGKSLLKHINNEELRWNYLNDYKKKVGFKY